MPLQLSTNKDLLYPPTPSFHSFELVSKDGQFTIPVHQYGTPDGTPILFFHGGPGGRCHATDACYFPPDRSHIILYDQRGSGSSSPHAAINSNQTELLLEDIEQIREHLKIDQWILFGGSWGSTLALIYATHYPERVKGMVLRGVFLGSQEEIRWLYEGKGANRIFPEEWQAFTTPISSDNIPPPSMVSSYYQILKNTKHPMFNRAATAWSQWEASLLSLLPKQEIQSIFLKDEHAIALARIEAHYFAHKLFLPDNWLAQGLAKIQAIPSYIIHGRYDMICPYESAWKLHKMLPLSQLFTIPDAGHTASERGITKKLMECVEQALL